MSQGDKMIKEMKEFLRQIEQTKIDVNVMLNVVNEQDMSNMAWNSIQGYLSSLKKRLESM